MITFSDTYLSPIGLLVICSDGKSVTKISFIDAYNDPVHPCELTNMAKNQLDQYFKAERFDFELPLSPEGTDFQKKVWNELLNVPFGQTRSYAEIASKTGSANNMRAVGNANGKNPIAIVIPCHRIIGSNGKLIGYAGGLWRKQWLLVHELKNTDTKDKLF